MCTPIEDSKCYILLEDFKMNIAALCVKLAHEKMKQAAAERKIDLWSLLNLL